MAKLRPRAIFFGFLLNCSLYLVLNFFSKALNFTAFLQHFQHFHITLIFFFGFSGFPYEFFWHADIK